LRRAGQHETDYQKRATDKRCAHEPAEETVYCHRSFSSVC
jgi:hypothetical protein